jgi:hypothetical protein
MKDAFGRADGDVLTGVERAAHNGRRITARRARRQKRARHASRGVRLGSVTLSPLVAVGLIVLVLAGAAGAAFAIAGTRSPGHEAATDRTRVVPVPSSTHATPSVVPTAKAVYVRYADETGYKYYLYCTAATGCGLLDIAQDGTSKIAVTPSGGVWHREQREVIRHDPCINIVENAVHVGKPGDLVRVETTDLRRVGTQTIKGIAAPARMVGELSVRYEHPDVAGCSFSGFSDFTRRVDSPVVEYVPKT